VAAMTATTMAAVTESKGRTKTRNVFAGDDTAGPAGLEGSRAVPRPCAPSRAAALLDGLHWDQIISGRRPCGAVVEAVASACGEKYGIRGGPDAELGSRNDVFFSTVKMREVGAQEADCGLSLQIHTTLIGERQHRGER
jgi:hypothetical protein